MLHKDLGWGGQPVVSEVSSGDLGVQVLGALGYWMQILTVKKLEYR